MRGKHQHIQLKTKINVRKTGFVWKPWKMCHQCGPGASLGNAGCEHRLVEKQHSHLWLWLSIMSVSWHTVCCHHVLQGLLHSSGRTCIFTPKHLQVCLGGPRSPRPLAGQKGISTSPPPDFHLGCRVPSLNRWICSQELSKNHAAIHWNKQERRNVLITELAWHFPA